MRLVGVLFLLFSWLRKRGHNLKLFLLHKFNVNSLHLLDVYFLHKEQHKGRSICLHILLFQPLNPLIILWGMNLYPIVIISHYFRLYLPLNIFLLVENSDFTRKIQILIDYLDCVETFKCFFRSLGACFRSKFGLNFLKGWFGSLLFYFLAVDSVGSLYNTHLISILFLLVCRLFCFNFVCVYSKFNHFFKNFTPV